MPRCPGSGRTSTISSCRSPASRGPDAEYLLRGDPADRAFSCLHLRDGRLIAIDAINRGADFLAAKALIRDAVPIDRTRAADLEVKLSDLCGLTATAHSAAGGSADSLPAPSSFLDLGRPPISTASQRVPSSLSSAIFRLMVSGTESSMPMGPSTQPQNSTETITTSGDSPSPWPK